MTTTTGIFGLGHPIGDYTIQALVQDGHAAADYLALDADGRQVMLRVFDPVTSLEPSFRSLILGLGERTVSFRHPGAVDLLAVGDDHGLLWYASALSDGEESLTARVSHEGVLGVSATVAVVEQIASVLDAAHAGGLMHGALSPDVVFVRGEGAQIDATVAGLGVSQPTPESPFVAPEARSDGRVGPSADVYSLGAIAFVGLTGHVPVALPGGMPLVSQVAPQLGSRFDGVLQWALAPAPDRRYRSAGELAAALRGAQGAAAVTAAAAGTQAAYPAPASVNASANGSPPAAPRRGTRTVWPWFALGAVLLALVVVGVVAAVGGFSGGDDAPPAPIRAVTPTVADFDRASRSRAADGPPAQSVAESEDAIVRTLEAYAAAYSAQDLERMRSILDPDVERSGLIPPAAGCQSSFGRDEVVDAVQANWRGVGGASYSLTDLDASKLDVDGRRGSGTFAYSLGGSSGSISFKFRRANGGKWRISKIDAC